MFARRFTHKLLSRHNGSKIEGKVLVGTLLVAGISVVGIVGCLATTHRYPKRKKPPPKKRTLEDITSGEQPYKQGSAIFHGRVYHSRFQPVKHSFNYPIFFCYLDLDDVENGCQNLPCWPIFSVKYPALARYRAKDHLKGMPGVEKVSDGVRDLVLSKTGMRPKGKIYLLTHLSYFGYCFNPVSFYYIYDEKNEKVETIVGEVSNTPWCEMHCYVLNPANQVDMRCEEHSREKQVYRFPKRFHVSPFMDMGHDYYWRFGPPGAALRVLNRMIKQQEGGVDETWFDATLVARRAPLTALQLARYLLLYPAYCWTVQWQIHVQAFKLWYKGVTFYPHPEGAETTASKAIAFLMAPLFKLQVMLTKSHS